MLKIFESPHVFTSTVNPSRDTDLAFRLYLRLEPETASMAETPTTTSGLSSKGFKKFTSTVNTLSPVFS